MKNKFKELCEKLIASIDEHYEQFPESESKSEEYALNFGGSQYYQILEEIRTELNLNKEK